MYSKAPATHPGFPTVAPCEHSYPPCGPPTPCTWHVPRCAAPRPPQSAGWWRPSHVPPWPPPPARRRPVGRGRRTSPARARRGWRAPPAGASWRGAPTPCRGCRTAPLRGNEQQYSRGPQQVKVATYVLRHAPQVCVCFATLSYSMDMMLCFAYNGGTRRCPTERASGSMLSPRAAVHPLCCCQPTIPGRRTPWLTAVQSLLEVLE